MFSRDDLRNIKEEFWTAFGIYMRQHVPQAGAKLKWANYKTGIRHMYFRLEVDGDSAWAAIDLQHAEEAIRELYFEQWEELRLLLEGGTGLEWAWHRGYFLPDGKEISRIEVRREGWSLFRREDWGAIFEFFAGIMVALDEIWVDAKEVFLDLES